MPYTTPVKYTATLLEAKMITKEKKKLTIRVDAKVIEQAKEYATLHDTSISELVEAFLRELERKEKETSATPILDQLTGILPQKVDIADYHTYLLEKYSEA
jgi:DNA-binding IclR family transcriptional regulator